MKATKNAVETLRQLQFECETISEFQLSHCLDGIFRPIINSEGPNLRMSELKEVPARPIPVLQS